jgi:hypothetical protein
MFVLNSVIESLSMNVEKKDYVRVLWISPTGEDVVVMNINNLRQLDFPYFLKQDHLLEEIESGRAKVVELKNDLRILSPSPAYLEKLLGRRDEKWEFIKDIVIAESDTYLSERRGPMIAEISERTGKSPKVLYDLLKKYWFYGKTENALINRYFNCGTEERSYSKKPGPKTDHTHILTEQDKEKFMFAIHTFHRREKMSLVDSHEQMLQVKYTTPGYSKNNVVIQIVDEANAPTFRQFHYWYMNEFSTKKRYANKHGDKEAEKKRLEHHGQCEPSGSWQDANRFRDRRWRTTPCRHTSSIVPS